MGKILEEMWDEYNEKGYTSKELHQLMTFNVNIKELTSGLSKEQIDKLMANDEESRQYHRSLEKRHFLKACAKAVL